MRTILLLATLLAFAAGPALAHATHGGCGSSLSVTNGPVHLDVYTRDCVGAAVIIPNARCVLQEDHIFLGVHTPILNGEGCETGVILERADLLA